MRWTRAKVPTLCGRCARRIEVGDPLLLLTIGSATKPIPKVRCTSCYGPAPPDLPSALELREARPPIDMTRLGLLPLVWSRDPGEEG